MKEHFKEEFRGNSDNLKKTLLEPQSTQEDKEAVEKAVNAIYQKCLEATQEPLEVLTVSLESTVIEVFIEEKISKLRI